jgi:hypothetical protein
MKKGDANHYAAHDCGSFFRSARGSATALDLRIEILG